MAGLELGLGLGLGLWLGLWWLVGELEKGRLCVLEDWEGWRLG